MLLQVLDLNLSAYDGIALRVKGDGQMYKVNLKTAERGEDPESTYAATFETSGEALFMHKRIHGFVAVIDTYRI